MTLNKPLGIPVSNSDFITGIWKSDNCDPQNWNYEPSTYGVVGAHLVGTPVMKLWSDTEDGDNPGRYEFKIADVIKLEDEIFPLAISTKFGRVLKARLNLLTFLIIFILCEGLILGKANNIEEIFSFSTSDSRDPGE